MVDREDGLVDAEGIDFTSGKCRRDGWVIIVLLEAYAIGPGCRVKCLRIESVTGQHLVIDHCGHERLRRGGAGGNADNLILQTCEICDTGILLYEYADVIGIVRCGEIPALLTLIGDGEGREYAVDITGVEKLGSGRCGNGGELYVHAEVLRDILCEGNLHTGILTRQRILIAEALNGILYTDAKDATIDDGLCISTDLRRSIATLGCCGGRLCSGCRRFSICSGRRCGCRGRRRCAGRTTGSQAHHHRCCHRHTGGSHHLSHNFLLLMCGCL